MTSEGFSGGQAARAAALGLALAAAVAAAAAVSRSATGSTAGRNSRTRGLHPGGPIADSQALLEAAGGEEAGLEARLSPSARVRFMGEMEDVVDTLETRVSRPAYAGAVRDAAQRVRSFCRHAYRVLGRDPSEISVEDARTALHDAALLQARAANSMSSLFMMSMRDRKRRALAEARDAFLASSEAHIAEMRRTIDAAPALEGGIWRTGRSGAYEPGRGFPAPWGGAEAEGHSMFGAGAEARYRVASEM
jgi:hypothetical protein